MRSNIIFDSVKLFKEYILNPESGFNAVDSGEDILESSFTPNKEKVSKISFLAANGDTIKIYYFSDESGFWKIKINTIYNTSIKVDCKNKWISFGYDSGTDYFSGLKEEGYDPENPKYRNGWISVI